MSVTNTELINYQDAESMARTYAMSVSALCVHASAIGDQLRLLAAAFPGGFRPAFELRYGDICVRLGEPTPEHLEKNLQDLEYRLRQSAWASLIDKMGIRKVMSSARWKELSSALHEQRYASTKGGPPPLPPIQGETMVSVLNGYAASANEFLEEAVREEYDFWRPCDWERRRGQLKTNQKSFFRLDRKVIKSYMVRAGYRGCWEPHYDRQQHLIAIDNIMHCLAGLGPVAEGYNGPLVDAIRTLPWSETVGRTDFFRFKCYRNGNLHLEFLRLDMLELFNQIASRKWIGTTDLA